MLDKELIQDQELRERITKYFNEAEPRAFFLGFILARLVDSTHIEALKSDLRTLERLSHNWAEGGEAVHAIHTLGTILHLRLPSENSDQTPPPKPVKQG